MIVENYNKISIQKKRRYAKSFLPIPNETDYRNGYIIRYFAKQIGEDEIIEIKKDQYDYFTNNRIGLYILVRFRWRIIGDKEEVELSNSKILKEIEKTYIGITKKINNLLQFWKG